MSVRHRCSLRHRGRRHPAAASAPRRRPTPSPGLDPVRRRLRRPACLYPCPDPSSDQVEPTKRPAATIRLSIVTPYAQVERPAPSLAGGPWRSALPGREPLSAHWASIGSFGVRPRYDFDLPSSGDGGPGISISRISRSCFCLASRYRRSKSQKAAVMLARTTIANTTTPRPRSMAQSNRRRFALAAAASRRKST